MVKRTTKQNDKEKYNKPRGFLERFTGSPSASPSATSNSKTNSAAAWIIIIVFIAILALVFWWITMMASAGDDPFKNLDY